MTSTVHAVMLTLTIRHVSISAPRHSPSATLNGCGAGLPLPMLSIGPAIQFLSSVLGFVLALRSPCICKSSVCLYDSRSVACAQHKANSQLHAADVGAYTKHIRPLCSRDPERDGRISPLFLVQPWFLCGALAEVFADSHAGDGMSAVDSRAPAFCGSAQHGVLQVVALQTCNPVGLELER